MMEQYLLRAQTVASHHQVHEMDAEQQRHRTELESPISPISSPSQQRYGSVGVAM